MIYRAELVMEVMKHIKNICNSLCGLGGMCDWYSYSSNREQIIFYLPMRH